MGRIRKGDCDMENLRLCKGLNQRCLCTIHPSLNTWQAVRSRRKEKKPIQGSTYCYQMHILMERANQIWRSKSIPFCGPERHIEIPTSIDSNSERNVSLESSCCCCCCCVVHSMVCRSKKKNSTQIATCLSVIGSSGLHSRFPVRAADIGRWDKESTYYTFVKRCFGAYSRYCWVYNKTHEVMRQRSIYTGGGKENKSALAS